MILPGAPDPDSEFMAGIAACLEPAAAKAVSDIDGKIRLSIALSLKRIADALPNPGDPGLFHNIEQLAWSAGRSFEQGRRTDR